MPIKDVSPQFTLLFSHFLLLQADCQNEVLDDELFPEDKTLHMYKVMSKSGDGIKWSTSSFFLRPITCDDNETVLLFSVRNQERSEAAYLRVMCISLFRVSDNLPEEFRMICQSEWVWGTENLSVQEESWRRSVTARSPDTQKISITTRLHEETASSHANTYSSTRTQYSHTLSQVFSHT